MARARRALSSSPSSLLTEKNKLSFVSYDSRELPVDLEDGEITDAEETKAENANVAAEADPAASEPVISDQVSPKSTTVTPEPKPPPANAITEEVYSSPGPPVSAETPATHALPPRALSEEELDLAKSIVLDLLGWGVQPEYLVECGVSSHAIYKIFTDLRLRLPSNLAYLG